MAPVSLPVALILCTKYSVINPGVDNGAKLDHLGLQQFIKVSIS